MPLKHVGRHVREATVRRPTVLLTYGCVTQRRTCLSSKDEPEPAGVALHLDTGN